MTTKPQTSPDADLLAFLRKLCPMKTTKNSDNLKPFLVSFGIRQIVLAADAGHAMSHFGYSRSSPYMRGIRIATQEEVTEYLEESGQTEVPVSCGTLKRERPPKSRTVPASNFVGTISANVDNTDLSDADFRQFVRNTLSIVQYTPGSSGFTDGGAD